MNEQRIYPSKVTANGSAIALYGIEAPNRRTAVRKALQWFWDKYEGKYGPASDVFTIGDPYKEVVFKEPFNCNDKGNNYLDEATKARVIEQSKGILERDSKTGSRHHPPRSLRRKKRRREYRVTIAPNIQESNTGTLYYRIVVTPQQSKNGVITTKRKVLDIKLEAKTLAQALEEIKTKNLRGLNKVSRRMKKRSLKLVAHLSGLQTLTQSDRSFFAPVLKNAARLSQ
ncbi:MAG: hypothetical protein HYV67_01240 [Candidatus Taylorbacteria bacterium]|nr:hypothetical protein [Candidatus Taylorbacteria bacterium]